MKLALIFAGITVCVLFIGWAEKDWTAAGIADGQARPRGLIDNALASGETGSSLSAVHPIRAWTKPDKDLAYRASQCGQMYLVVNLDGSLRCAQLVPGVNWQPYLSPDDERQALTRHLQQLARKR